MSRILGLDYGSKRLGVAISDPTRMLATPLRTEPVASAKDAVDRVCALCEETGAREIVIGLPLNMDGSAGDMAAAAEAFAERVERRTRLPVHRWDERLSTRLVDRMLIEADVSRGKRRKVRDKLAAQVILQSYLDAQETAGASPP